MAIFMTPHFVLTSVTKTFGAVGSLVGSVAGTGTALGRMLRWIRFKLHCCAASGGGSVNRTVNASLDQISTDDQDSVVHKTWKVLSLMNFDISELQEECSLEDDFFVRVCLSGHFIRLVCDLWPVAPRMRVHTQT